MNVIPHSSVIVQYTTTGATVTTPAYYGVMSGPFKDVHYFYKKPNAFYDESIGYEPDSDDTRVLDANNDYVYVNKSIASISPDTGYDYPGANPYFTTDTATVAIAYDDILWRYNLLDNSNSDANTTTKAWYYYTGSAMNKFVLTDKNALTAVEIPYGSNTGDLTIPAELFGCMVIAVSTASSITNISHLFRVPSAESATVTDSYKIYGKSEKVAEGITVTTYDSTTDTVKISRNTDSIKAWIVYISDLSKLNHIEDTTSDVTHYCYIGEDTVLTNYTDYFNVYSDEVTEENPINNWDGNLGSKTLLASVSSVEELNGKNSVIQLSIESIMNVDRSLNLTTESDALFTVSSISFKCADVVNKNYVYNVDPTTTVVTSVIKYADLIAPFNVLEYEDSNGNNFKAQYAKAHVEYLGDFTSAAYLNRIFNSNETMPFTWGKPHPDNPLGFGVALTNLYNPSTVYRICIAENKSKFLTTIEKYRDCVYVANLWDEFGQSVNEETWLSNRKTNKSDYRMFFTWKSFSDKSYRKGSDTVYYNAPDSNGYTVDGAVNYVYNNTEEFITDGVLIGDKVQVLYPDGSAGVIDDITNVSETQIDFTNDLRTKAKVTLNSTSGALLQSKSTIVIGGSDAVGGNVTVTIKEITSTSITLTDGSTSTAAADLASAITTQYSGIGIASATADGSTVTIVSTGAIDDLNVSVTPITGMTYTFTVSNAARTVSVNVNGWAFTIPFTFADCGTNVDAMAEYLVDQINAQARFCELYSSYYTETNTTTNVVHILSDYDIDFNTLTFTMTLNNAVSGSGFTFTKAVADNSYSVSLKVYKQLTSAEVKDAAVLAQTSTDPELVKVYNGNIKWTPVSTNTTTTDAEYISNKFFVPVIFGMKISYPEQKPLSNIGLSSGNFNDVLGSFEFFTEDEMDALVGAGYFMYAKIPNGLVYCVREATCGLKTGDVFRGNLNAVTPVVTFAYSVYNMSKSYLGIYNITDETKTMIKAALGSLCSAYTSRPVAYLGTRLAKAAINKIEEIEDGVKITYNVTPQRSLNVIDNVVIVTNQ